MAKKRRAPAPGHRTQPLQPTRPRQRSASTPPTKPVRRGTPTWLLLGGVLVAAVAVIGVGFFLSRGGGGAPPTTTPASARPSFNVGPPTATPLVSPPAEPSSSGATVTIQTRKGTIVIQVFDQSSPVAATNFLNLAQAGYYNGLTFHRLVPGFVIQGGDPKGDGTGGPGYTIPDEPIVGQYGRGIVAMARTGAKNSAGSQFFIVLSDGARDDLERFRTYQIFGRVTQGMDVADAIAAMPNAGSAQGNRALDPVAMDSVTVQRP
jgi:peptidyl-prolyl cis-trans isomerase B (cyclophilin B)